VDRSNAQGALVEALKSPRGWGAGWGYPLPLERSGEGLDPLSRNFLLLELKMEHFGAVFKPDLTEETRTQLQDEAIASSRPHTGYAYAITITTITTTTTVMTSRMMC